MSKQLNKEINVKKIVAVLCAMILFISSWAPFMEGSPLGSDSLRRLLNYAIWLLIGVSFVIGPKRIAFSSFELIAIAAIIIFRAFNILHAYDYKGLGISSVVFCVFFCYLADDCRSDVFRVFRYFVIIISSIGIVLYVSYVLNLKIPYTIVRRDDGLEWINYRICYLMKQSPTMVRFNGTFEEPGWFGTWAAFFLCADDLNFRKKGNIILLISGLLTYSLAFILLLVIYYVLKNLSDWKRWIWLVLLVAFYLFVIPHIKTGNEAVDRVLERLAISDGGLAGDNRTGPLFAKVWEETVHSSKIVLGQGAGYAQFFGTGEGEGLASIKSNIVDFGVIGTVIIYLPLFIASINKAKKFGNKTMLRYIIISYVSLYQRPYLFSTPHLIMFVCGIAYTKMSQNKNEEKLKAMLQLR